MDTNQANFGYEIRVKGHLDLYWVPWFEGWTISNVENGEALLRNMNVDQSGLHSTLSRVRDLNLVLISVVQVPRQPTQP